MIIGLNGLKGSGKDTAAAYLIKKHGFERKAFADPLKKSIAALLNIPYHEIDKLKNNPQVCVELMEYAGPNDRFGINPNPKILHGSGFTFREFLQRYGTEAHRDVFGENFWLDHTLPVQGSYAGRKIVITDVRFVNEAQRVREIGGHVIKIHRPGSDEQDPHRSEEELRNEWVDVVVTNDGTIEDFGIKLDDVLTVLGGVGLPWGDPDAQIGELNSMQDIRDALQRSYDKGIQ